MRTVNIHSTLIVAAVAAAAFVWQANPADAAKKGGSAAQRDAMIEQCIAKAQAEAPVVTPGMSGNRRTEIYKNCMVQAGFRP